MCDSELQFSGKATEFDFVSYANRIVQIEHHDQLGFESAYAELVNRGFISSVPPQNINGT